MAGNTIGEAWVAIRPDTSGFESALTTGIGGALGKVNLGFLAVGASILGVAGIALKLSSDFTTALSQVEARMNITAKAGNAIGAAFLSTAGKATFSAIQITQAFAPVAGQLEMVNKGALSASQSLNFMNTAMALADATGMSLASATSDLAGILQTFGLNLKQASDASDILYNASNALGVPIDSLTTSLDRARTQAGAASPTLADLSTLLVDLTEHGETGRGAMTILSAALTGIIAPTAKVLAYQKELNVSFVTANGQLKPLATIIGELNPLIKNQGDIEAAATLKALGFGSAGSKLVDTIKAGLPAWNAANAAVSRQGAVQAAAGTATDNLGGAWRRLSSNVTDMLTQSGQPLNKFLTQVVNTLDKDLKPAVTWAIQWFPVWGRILAGIVATWVAWNVAMGVGAVIRGIAFVIGATPGMVAFAAASWAAAAPWIAIAAAVGATAFYLGVLISNKGVGTGAQSSARGELDPGFARFGNLQGIPPRAGGGPVSAGMGYMVGEQGPEFFRPSTNGTIIPHGSSAGGMTQVNYFYGVGKETIELVDQRIQKNNRNLQLVLRAH